MDDTELALVNQYFLDSTYTADTITHLSPGLAGGCAGTWVHVEGLSSDTDDNTVIVQRLLSPLEEVKYTATGNRPNPYVSTDKTLPPPLMRAVKILPCYRSYPEVDNRPMIKRGILCMARANVSDSIAVVRMLGWFEDGRYAYIAMEYYSAGNLRDFIKKYPILPEMQVREAIRQILGVLVELSLSQLTHRNITTTNILIASTFPIRVRLGDFHNAKWLTEGDGPRTQVGSLPYIAPEMRGTVLPSSHRLAHTYDTKVDMWALGIILHEMLTKTHPFHQPERTKFSEGRYARWFMSGEQEVGLGALEGAGQHVRSFVASLLRRDPEQRPTPQEALQAPWFVGPVE